MVIAGEIGVERVQVKERLTEENESESESDCTDPGGIASFLKRFIRRWK